MDVAPLVDSAPVVVFKKWAGLDSLRFDGWRLIVDKGSQ